MLTYLNFEQKFSGALCFIINGRMSRRTCYNGVRFPVSPVVLTSYNLVHNGIFQIFLNQKTTELYETNFKCDCNGGQLWGIEIPKTDRNFIHKMIVHCYPIMIDHEESWKYTVGCEIIRDNQKVRLLEVIA